MPRVTQSKGIMLVPLGWGAEPCHMPLVQPCGGFGDPQKLQDACHPLGRKEKEADSF